ncbi:MAG: hypothetical protein K0U72_11975 [Gammaproteobacteria bacterium]|nr:hypothetical protein [Gammaproteobacteria bacterium]
MDNDDDDLQLRAEAKRHAPRPSAAHDEAVLSAARAKARHKKPRRPQRRWLMAGVGLAASVFLAIGLLQTQSTVVPDVDRSGGGADAAAWPSGNVELSSQPTEFRWSEQGDDSRYRLRLHNDAAELLWESDWVLTAQVSVDEEVAALLSSGERYFWIVNVEGSMSNPSMGPYWFRIQ